MEEKQMNLKKLYVEMITNLEHEIRDNKKDLQFFGKFYIKYLASDNTDIRRQYKKFLENKKKLIEENKRDILKHKTFLNSLDEDE